MLDILRQHLAASSTPEMLATVEQAHQTFERIELQNYEQGFEEILLINEAEVAAGVDVSQSVLQLTEELLRQILSDHGITCTPETTCQQLTELVNALLDLPNYSDVGTLAATADLDGSPRDILSEILPLLTSFSPEDALSCLEEVDFFLIRRIKETARRDLSSEEQQEQQERAARHIAKLQRSVNSAVLSSQLSVTAALKQGMPVGLPFFVYIQRFGHELQRWTAERSAQELLAMAFASRDGIDNPRGVIEQHLEKYVSLSDRVVEIEVHMGDKLLKLEQYREEA